MDKLNAINHYSVSSLETWVSCPVSWWSKYVLKETTPSTSAASFGSAFDKAVGEAFNLKPEDSREDEKEIVLSPEDKEELEAMVNGYLSQPWAIKNPSFIQRKILVPPSHFESLTGGLGLSLSIKRPILGYIDIGSDADMKLVDLKTSSRQGMQVKWAFQLLVYALATQFTTAEIHLGTRTKKPGFFRYYVPVDKATLSWAASYFAFYASQIEAALEMGCSEGLPCRPDYYCSWCARNLSCPVKLKINL